MAFGEYSSLSGSEHTKPARSQVRGGMPTDDSTYIATLSGVPRCEGSSSLSVEAGEGNFLAYPRRLQVPKLNGEQVTDGKQEPTHQWNRCVKRSFVRACNRDRAMRHGQAQPLYLCTSRSLQIPEECVAADHPCLVPNADRKPAAATYPILGWDGPHWVPAPHKLRDVVWILATPFQVAVSKCEKTVFWRCSAARPSLGTELHGSQCAFQRVLAVHRTTGC